MIKKKKMEKSFSPLPAMQNYLLFYLSTLLVVIIVFPIIASATDGVDTTNESLDFYFRSGDRPVAAYEGAKAVEIACVQNLAGANGALTSVAVKHVNAVSSVKRDIGKLLRLDSADVTEGYYLSAAEEDGRKTVILTVDTVTTEDDGLFVFDFTDGTRVETASKNFTVIRELQTLSLQFQDSDPVFEKPEDPIETVAGNYSVRCIAEGSNPPTRDVKLFMNGDEVTFPGEPAIALMTRDSVRRYRTTGVGTVALPKRKAVWYLKCLARDTSGKQLSVTMEVSVSVPEGENVQCEVAANEDDSVLSIVCLVDFADEGGAGAAFAFEIGKTGEIIRPGSGGGDKATNVTTRRVSDSQTEVTLTLSDPESWHFESDFYLILNTTSGNVRKEILKLRGRGGTDEGTSRGGGGGGGRGGGGDGDNAVCFTASKGWVLFLALVVVWKSTRVML